MSGVLGIWLRSLASVRSLIGIWLRSLASVRSLIGIWLRSLASVLVATPLCGLAAACHSPEDDADLLPPSGVSLAPAPPITSSSLGPVRFRAGWYQMESNATESWRWMAATGEIELPRAREPAELTIAGWAPVELVEGPLRLRISIDGRLLDDFAAPTGRFVRNYQVAPAPEEGHPRPVLRIETSTTGKAPKDPRALGFALVELAWRAAR
jgi:hypothetical protein